MDVESPRFKVAAARRILHRAGLDPDDIAGQVALRADDERDCCWTSPMETFDVTTPDTVGLRRTDPDLFAFVDEREE